MWAEELRYGSSSLPIFCAACLVCTLHFLVGGHEPTSCFLHLRPKKKKKLNGNLFGKMPPIKKFIAKGRILGLTPKFRSLKSLVENWRVCFDVCPLQFWPNFAFVMIKTFKLQNSHTSYLLCLYTLKHFYIGVVLVLFEFSWAITNYI